MQKKDQDGGGATLPAAKTAKKPPAAAAVVPDGGPGWRADRGPRALGALLPALTRPVFRKRSPAAAQLILDWPQIAGPVLAAQTVPRAVSGGTLTLACSGPVAMELQHLAPQLIGRINTAMGQALVQRLRFVQAALPPPRRAPPPPAPVVLPEKLSAALDGVEDPELRAALARLGQGVYRGRRSPG